MEAQEAAWEAQLAAARARQSQQAADAAARPEFKKWLDPDIIDRNARSLLVHHLNDWHNTFRCHAATLPPILQLAWKAQLSCLSDDARLHERLLAVETGFATAQSVKDDRLNAHRERDAAEAEEEARRRSEVAAKKSALQARGHPPKTRCHS